jgi:uncharacterized protein YdaU (DUF1376 family)
MSKDPAFLFYSSDFLTGTSFLTNEQVGMYIRLLCHQHQNGHLKEKDILKICGSHDEDIFDKFEKDSDGLFFNERLDTEINKRKAYSESRANNRKKKELPEEKPLTHEKDMLNTSITYVEHMENEIENEDIIIIDNLNKDDIEIKKEVSPEILKKQEPPIEEIFEYFWAAYQRRGNKQDSFTAFKKLTKKQMIEVKEHIPKYLENHHRNGVMKYLPFFSKYLNKKIWLDNLPYEDKKEKINSWGV